MERGGGSKHKPIQIDTSSIHQELLGALKLRSDKPLLREDNYLGIILDLRLT